MTEKRIFQQLFDEPYRFDFFQACRLLGRWPYTLAKTNSNSLSPEPARFRAHLGFTFPPSSICDLKVANTAEKLPTLTVAFLGLFGPSGVLPRHYTELLFRMDRDGRGDERHAFRDWLDLFNHRFIYHFYRAWDKYRFWLAYERSEPVLDHPDPFTRSLLGVMGLATHHLRNRLIVTAANAESEDAVELARIHDLGILRFAGIFAQRHRNAWGLRAVLMQYFVVPIEVLQYAGQWLPLEESSQSCLPSGDSFGQNCQLGLNTVAGSQVWNIQGKFRIRLGPLSYHQFLDYLPDFAPTPERKAFFLLSQLARLYAGPEYDFDIQLVLKPEDVPYCQLTSDPVTSPRLGWSCWLLTKPPSQPVEDVIFDGADVTRVGI